MATSQPMSFAAVCSSKQQWASYGQHVVFLSFGEQVRASVLQFGNCDTIKYVGENKAILCLRYVSLVRAHVKPYSWVDSTFVSPPTGLVLNSSDKILVVGAASHVYCGAASQLWAQPETVMSVCISTYIFWAIGSCQSNMTALRSYLPSLVDSTGAMGVVRSCAHP
jgi:hypothetical protein